MPTEEELQFLLMVIEADTRMSGVNWCPRPELNVRQTVQESAFTTLLQPTQAKSSQELWEKPTLAGVGWNELE